jgi:hypothetical protein
MALESRTRMVSFRLSNDEYFRFRQLCSTTGVRSVSELARLAINAFLQDPSRAVPESFDARISDLESRLRLLALEVKDLHEKIKQIMTQ